MTQLGILKHWNQSTLCMEYTDSSLAHIYLHLNEELSEIQH